MSAPHRGAGARPVPERVAALDRLLAELGRSRHRLVHALARGASDLERSSAWSVFGYTTREDFTRAVLGRSGRWLRDLATLQEKMEALPALGRAVGGLDGGPPIGRVAALWVGRVATPETVKAWIGRARRETLQRLRTAVEEAAGESPVTSPTESVETAVEKETFTSDLTPEESWAMAEVQDVLGAVMGREVSPRECFEALLAEASAGPWNPEFTPKSRPRPAASPLESDSGAPFRRDSEVDAPPAPSELEASPSSPHDLEPKTTAERKALRTLRRMMELSRGLLQATRQVCIESDASASEAHPEEPQAADAKTAPEASAQEALERALRALEAGLQAKQADVAQAVDAKTAPGARAREALERVRRALEADAQAKQAVDAQATDTQATDAPAADAPAADAQKVSAQKADALASALAVIEPSLDGSKLERRAPEAASPRNQDTSGASPEPGRFRIRQVIRIVYQMRELVHLEDEIEIRIAELLLDLMDRRAWRCLGYTGLAQYAEERLGLGRTAAHGRVRLARGLRRLPHVRAAYEAGRIGMEEAAWIVRYLTSAKRHVPGGPDATVQEAGNEHAETTTLKRLGDERRMQQEKELSDLIALAREMSMRRAGRKRPQPAGDGAGVGTPGEADAVGSSPSATAEETANSPEAPSVGSSPEPKGVAPAALFPDDAVWFAFLRREPGQARKRVIGLGHGQLERVTRRGALLERRYSWPLEPDLKARLEATLGVTRADLMRRAQEYADRISPAQEARLLPSERMALEYHRRRQPLRRGVALLALAEEFVRVWDNPAAMTRRPLDAIHNRTGWRCSAPGCTRRRNLQVHHLCYRSLGGGEEVENKISICGFHHLQGEHGRYARCLGRAPLNVDWRLGVAELHIWYRNERRIRPPEALMRA